MTYPQIRISKTPQMQEMFSFFQTQYFGLSESEIVKVVLSDQYYKAKKNAVLLQEMNVSELTAEQKKQYEESFHISPSSLHNL